MTREERAPSSLRRRLDPRASLKRDLTRLEHREPGDASFWRSLGVIGAVGWPIVIATVGGALAGRWLHAHWETGFGVTALLVGAGAALGMAIVWRLIQPRQR
jgi:ATP synthase protein I